MNSTATNESLSTFIQRMLKNVSRAANSVITLISPKHFLDNHVFSSLGADAVPAREAAQPSAQPREEAPPLAPRTIEERGLPGRLAQIFAGGAIPGSSNDMLPEPPKDVPNAALTGRERRPGTVEEIGSTSSSFDVDAML